MDQVIVNGISCNRILFENLNLHITEEEKRPYPEMEEVELAYIDSPYNAKILFMDYHIGVVLVRVDKPEKHIRCLHGPLSMFSRNAYSMDKEGMLYIYDRLFKAFKQEAENGYYDRETGVRIMEMVNPGTNRPLYTGGLEPGPDTCPIAF